MPTLPSDGIFSIDSVMRKGSGTNVDAVVWQWKDDRNLWHPYTPIDSKIIEVSKLPDLSHTGFVQACKVLEYTGLS